jgi:predicted CXXCH cytochrome family protein
MNRTELAILVPIVLWFSIVLLQPCESFAFETADEYYSHVGTFGVCVSQECHADLGYSKDPMLHKPVTNNECDECHTGNYPNKYGLADDQGFSCLKCHRKIENEVQTSRFVHGPAKSGDCVSCHDAHGSGRKYLLNESYSDLCQSCHNLKSLYRGEAVHQPVKDGNCGLCHDVHASDYKFRLTESRANLCLACHDEMVSGMTKEFVHEPLIKSGCTDCHDPHSGKNSLRLKAEPDKLCFSCHEEKLNEIEQYDKKHAPANEGDCISCHSPHYSDTRYLLNDKIDRLCFKCHKEKEMWKKRRFQHGPVVQGNCSACHNPHGSDNAYVLRLSFPHKFYTNYEKGKYDLCFNCHKEAMVTTEKSETVTDFRNGNINLHRLHVNMEKGRTCRACHNIHASDQYDHLREGFMFGTVNIPIYYFKSETGGMCVPGCHKERKYDRIEKVENN